MKRLPLLILLLCLQMSAIAQRPEFAPGARYDSRIPSLKQVTGYDFAERVTPPEDIIRYLRALNEAAPNRTRLIKYAETWEKRELYALITGSPERIARLDEIKAGLQKLANPASISNGELKKLIKELPVVVALVHGVHGNEISSGEAAMAEAYHLLSAQNDPVVEQIRREALVIIDPMQNPDGRARFVFQNLLGQAAGPDSEPASAEHDEPWPGGRSNHYLFDLNRDWFAQTQPESRGRVKLMLEWMPQVVVDLHEMGGDSTYYFPPSAEPMNPHMTKAQSGWLEAFGKANAARFDERGFGYFNREVFDAFYPGYGVSWPMAQGAIGMTFEKASARGLTYRRSDGSILTYRDGAVEHFTAAMSTLQTAAAGREKMLRDFAEFRRNAGQGTVRAYYLPEGRDPGQAQRLVRTLLSNGITVERIEQAVTVDGRSLQPGTFVVPLPQPAGMLVRNLLDPQVPMNEEFIKTQEERRRRRLPDQIYDTTAWNMPMLWDVECIGSTSAVSVKTTRLDLASVSRSAPATKTDALVGYALVWNATSAAAAIEALREGLTARFISQPFTIDGRKFDRGAAVFRVSDNGLNFRAKLETIAAKHGADLIRLDSAFVSEGASLGSNQTVTLKAPRVLLAWDAPASSLSAGWARYVMERRYGQSVTAVRAGSLARVDLRRFDVLVLPSGNYATAISGENLRRIKDWVSAGGTLITLGEASRWATRDSTALLDTRTELRDGSPETDSLQARTEASKGPFDYEKAIQPLREQPENTPGSILRVKLDPDHWLSSGTDGEIQVLVEGTRVFSPIRIDRGRNVGTYAVIDKLLASGHLWPEPKQQLPGKAFLIHQPSGQGHLIAFAEDPNYRAYAEATEFLFINAVLLGVGY
ncbi:MAG: peptidase M14 [Acidobacteria bacterium]|nr:peptidase M14 [Acidobacteriota bacterium]